VPARLLVNIAWQHLSSPLRHLPECEEKCAPGCPVQAFDEAVAAPVLPSEIAEEKAREERFQAFADQLNSFSRGE
jgi:hypothetical protein